MYKRSSNVNRGGGDGGDGLVTSSWQSALNSNISVIAFSPNEPAIQMKACSRWDLARSRLDDSASNANRLENVFL